MKKSIVILSLIFLMGISMSLFAADVVGKWEMTSQSPRGERTSTIEFYMEDGKLMVKIEGRRGEMTAEVTRKGDTISWEISRETPRGEFTMQYEGTVKGDTMEGTMNIAQMDRSMDWTAKKQ